MVAHETESYRSPDGKHSITFTYEGEIRFGPKYWNVAVDNILIKKRIFGTEHRFSPDSKFVALQEQEYVNSESIVTYLVLIDLITKKITRLSKAADGWLLPLDLGQDKVIYNKFYPADGRTVEYEMDTTTISIWNNLVDS